MDKPIKKFTLHKRWWFWVLIGIILFLFVIIVASSSDQQSSTPVPTQNVANTAVSSLSTNQAYRNAVIASVVPFLESGAQDIQMSVNDASGQDFVGALSNAKGAQAAFATAKKNYDALPLVPANMTEENTLIGRAITSYQQASEELISGINTLNPSIINAAGAHITEATEYIKQATNLVTQ